MIELKLDNSCVIIEAGELVSYRVNDYEFIHQKGNPGWRNSDTEMFPIIGPTEKSNYEVWTPKGTAVQDQHGLLRELDYELELQSGNTAIFQKNYIANTRVNNSKYPNKSKVKELHWPYGFKFQKIFKLTNKGLEICFKITAEEGMPYMLGYHPAFKTESKNTKIEIGDRTIELYEVKSAGSKAYPVPNSTVLKLINKNKLKLETEGFGQFMLWTEVDTMLCMEPVTFYPYYDVTQDNLHNGFNHIGKVPKAYRVFLEPITL